MIVTLAGHVDHGKTSLVEALTGVNTDTLAEERRRGLTIDLGFSYTDIAGRRIGFVDVPGHHRFIHNMVAGVAGRGRGAGLESWSATSSSGSSSGSAPASCCSSS